MSLLDPGDYGIGSDFQDQRDELLALESIYSDRPDSFSYSVLDRNGASILQGSVKLQLPQLEKPIKIQKTGLGSFEITYLPPVTLCFEFPHDYPSTVAPTFSLVSIWIGSDLANCLATALSKIWEEYRGMPVLFAWIQALEEEIVHYFCDNNDINLDKFEMATLPKQSSVELKDFDIAKEFKDYQELAAQADFEKGWYDCEVCFESRSGADSIRYTPCGHVFCVDCVSAFYHQRLKDSTVKRLECLTEGCESFASQAQLRRTLTPAELERYERQLLEGALDLMSDVVTCPRVSCQAPVLLESPPEEDSVSRSVLPGRCSVCSYTFCVLCKKTYHGLEPCAIDSELREKLVMQYENATPEEKDTIHKRFGGRLNFLREMEALKSSKWIEKNSVHCPRCNVAIEKNSGCNKMSCTKCGQAFCWLCRTTLSAGNPYAHFNTGGSSCYNRLFEGVEASDDEEEEGADFWFGAGDIDSSDLED